MNTICVGDKNLIWQNGDMRAAGRRFFDKAGVTPFSQSNHRHRTDQRNAYNDLHSTNGPKQTNQAEIATTRLAKISRQPPSQKQLSP